MSLLDLFRKEPAKDFKEEPLPSITLVIRKLEEINARNPVHSERKITRSGVEISNHTDPVDFIRRNIRLWDNDHYLDASWTMNEGKYKIVKKDEETDRTMRVKVPVSEYRVKFHNFVMIPLNGSEPNAENAESVPIIKKRRTVIEGVFSFYVQR